MSTRPQIKPHQIIPSPYGNPANGASMAGNITSEPTILSNVSMCSYGASWTGSTPVGTLSVEVSNDYSVDPLGNVKNAGTWNTLTLSLAGAPVTSIPVTGDTGNALIDIEQTAAYAIRLVYTFTSGTGTLQAIVCGKVQ